MADGIRPSDRLLPMDRTLEPRPRLSGPTANKINSPKSWDKGIPARPARGPGGSGFPIASTQAPCTEPQGEASLCPRGPQNKAPGNILSQTGASKAKASPAPAQRLPPSGSASRPASPPQLPGPPRSSPNLPWNEPRARSREARIPGAASCPQPHLMKHLGPPL